MLEKSLTLSVANGYVHTTKLQFNADNVRLGLRRAFWFPSFMGIADFILAGEGRKRIDLYAYMNEYHMLACIIMRNKV